MGIKEKLQSHSRVKIWAAAVLILLVLFVALIVVITQSKPHRTEQYKETSGSAGLNAIINYDCGDTCGQKFNFNVYIYNHNGQQVNVVRPDKDGHVNLALAGGNYVMLIGKQFGKSAIFPQEPLALKNGKTLELKLEYK